jgi:DNA-binding transcriptional ArsR family regulator
MVNSRLDAVFAALADPTRRAMVAAVAGGGPQSAGALAAPHAMSLPAASKHLSVLTRAGLLTRERQGRHQVFSLNAEPFDDAVSWLEQHRRFWNDRLDALNAYLAITEESQ